MEHTIVVRVGDPARELGLGNLRVRAEEIEQPIGRIRVADNIFAVNKGNPLNGLGVEETNGHFELVCFIRGNIDQISGLSG